MADPETLYGYILLLQRRMREIRLRLPSPLSAVEGIAVGWLTHSPELTATDLSKLLGITLSKASRIISNLTRTGCIEAQRDKADLRMKQLSFTDRGLQFLQETIQLSSQIAELGIAPLSSSERVRFIRHFQTLNDGLGIANMPVQPGENPLVPQQMRHTQVSGMLGSSYLGSGLELLGHQILFELARKSAPVLFSDLSRALPFHPSRISRLLSAFEKKRYVSKFVPAGDKRAVASVLTEKGRAYYRELLQIADKRYKPALALFAKTDLEDFCDLLRVITDAPIPKETKGDLRLHICTTSRDRKRARAFLVEYLLKERLHHNLDQFLVADDSFCCLAERVNTVEGLIEVAIEDNQAKLRFFALSAKLRATDTAASVFGRSLKMFFEKEKTEALSIDPERVPREVLGRVLSLRPPTDRIHITVSDLAKLL